MKKSVILTLAIAASMIIAGVVAVHAKTVTPPSKPEFSAYEATFEKGDSGIKSSSWCRGTAPHFGGRIQERWESD